MHNSLGGITGICQGLANLAAQIDDLKHGERPLQQSGEIVTLYIFLHDVQDIGLHHQVIQADNVRLRKLGRQLNGGAVVLNIWRGNHFHRHRAL